MVDLSAEIAGLWTSLGAPTPGRPRIIQVAAAREGQGASTVARELAFYAAHNAGRSVWLVDMDLVASPQHAALAADPSRFGRLGEPVAATPDGSMFFTVQPGATGADGAPFPDGGYLAAYRVGADRLWVTRFRREVLRRGQSVHVLHSPDYWSALRRHADLVVVDAPAANRSQAATTIAPFADQTLLVVSADSVAPQEVANLRDAITASGGPLAGVFFNRMAAEAPAFLRNFLP